MIALRARQALSLGALGGNDLQALANSLQANSTDYAVGSDELAELRGKQIAWGRPLRDPWRRTSRWPDRCCRPMRS